MLLSLSLSLSSKEKDKDNSDSKLNSVDTQTVSTSSLVFSWKQVLSSNKCHGNKPTMTTWFLICDLRHLFIILSQVNNWQLLMQDLQKGVHLAHVSSYTYGVIISSGYETIILSTHGRSLILRCQ